jgi:hypothetical protein
MKETKKKGQLLLTLKNSSKRLENEQQPEEERQAELKVLDTSICGCDFGLPCCPEDK